MTLLCIGAISLKAQENEIPKTTQAFGLAIGAGDGIYSGALSWNRTHGLFNGKKIRLGYGLRFSGFSGSNLTYTTAPAKLASDESTIDTLIVNSPLAMGLSASIHIEYLFTPKLKAGFNIDAIGLGFGSESSTTFISSENTGNFPVNPSARPTPFNLLLVGDNDIGYLKSEFFIAYAISEKLWLRGGMDMTFSEYTTSVKLTNNNDRFRYKAIMFFLGISFNPFTGNE
ncbi:MAG: hypothetical protein H0V01_02560 [Bacteroidetes bacterium]|nr:hypothetical protein [Bacteroidota bacterium]